MIDNITLESTGVEVGINLFIDNDDKRTFLWMKIVITIHNEDNKISGNIFDRTLNLIVSDGEHDDTFYLRHSLLG